MMNFFFGASLCLNAILLIFLAVCWKAIRTASKEESYYDELKDFIHNDDNWGRIDNLDPPVTNYQLVRSVGRKQDIPRR